MKLKVLLLALFAAGLACSIALASPGHGGDGQTTSAHGPGTHAGTHADSHGDAGAKGKDAGSCRNVSLKGTLGDATLSLAVSRSSAPAKALRGTTVKLAVTGAASVVARVCGSGGAQTLELRVLKVGTPKETTATGTTSETTTTETTTTGAAQTTTH